MTTQIQAIPPQKVLEFARFLSPADLHWLREQLDKPLDDAPLPESATLDEAIELYLTDKCGLSRAAELAGVSRWHIQDILAKRGTPANFHYNLNKKEETDDYATRNEAFRNRAS